MLEILLLSRKYVYLFGDNSFTFRMFYFPCFSPLQRERRIFFDYITSEVLKSRAMHLAFHDFDIYSSVHPSVFMEKFQLKWKIIQFKWSSFLYCLLSVRFLGIALKPFYLIKWKKILSMLSNLKLISRYEEVWKYPK